MLESITPGIGTLINPTREQIVVTKELVTETLSFFEYLAKTDETYTGGELAKYYEKNLCFYRFRYGCTNRLSVKRKTVSD
jgi:hypothetical protein